MKRRDYILKNAFLLLVPILLWNWLLMDYLPPVYQPDIFWEDIPSWIALPENMFRIAVFVLPALMIISLKSKTGKRGMSLYVVGSLLYYLSWLMVMRYPESAWSKSIIGFTAPAWTTIFWLSGIAMLGSRSILSLSKLNWIYAFMALSFVCFHTIHAVWIALRL